jgi:vitamin B12 transporter
MVSLTVRAGAAALLAASAAAHAQDPLRSEPPVVVTANRLQLAIDDTLSSVSVIDRARIEAYGALDVVDLLRAEAGVDVVRTGGLGAQTAIFMRGANSNQVLVLIDGVRVSSSTAGTYAFEQLPLAQVERIEIVRGPRAALYGSDAIGGVIQIFTRRQNDFDATVGIGNHDTWRLDAGAGWALGEGRIGLRLGTLDTAGFNAQNPRGFSFDPDRDGFRQRSAAFDLELPLGAVVMDAQANHAESDLEFDQGESDLRNSQLSVGLASADREAWSLRASQAENVYDTPAFFSRFETRRRQLDWQQLALVSGRNSLLWGLSWVEDDGASIDTFSGSDQYAGSREHRAGFLAWRGAVSRLSWELTGRHDDYDGFGGRSSAQGALGWQMSDAWLLRGNLGQGFRAPDLNQLFSPGFGGLFAGNPALDPERSRTAELALGYRAAPWQLDLQVYDTRVRDLIDFSGGNTFAAINIGRAELRGAEVSWRWDRADWQLGGNLGWQEARNAITDTDLLRRAPRKANVQVARRLASWWLQVDLHAASPRPDLGGELPGYGLVGLSVQRPLAGGWSLALRVDNLFDRDYELANGYNAAGTSSLLQLRWNAGG